MFTSSRTKALFGRTLVAIAAVAACNIASALPTFTFNPAGAGLAGTAFTADNLLVSDFATVKSTPTGFTETGFLAFTGAQIDDVQVATPGLGSTYGLYIAFTANGTGAYAATSGKNTFSGGNVDSLKYTLYGFNGMGKFTSTSAPTPTVKLGTGSLVDGSFTGTVSSGLVTSAGLNATLSFATSATSGTFFSSPTPFYALAQSAFINTPSEITTTSTGFDIMKGGGTVNFVAAPVPEPETYALMLGGLAALGFIGRRRAR